MMKFVSYKTTIQPSRRSFLSGATTLLSASLIFNTPFNTPLAHAAASSDAFMTASSLLIQHSLSPDVGARIATTMRKSTPEFDTHIENIIATARSKNAKIVEDFFNDLPQPTQEFAHKIIFSWYAGASDASMDAEVFSFELALMYQPVKDAMAIPSYAFSGPNNWTNVNPPLSVIPQF